MMQCVALCSVLHYVAISERELDQLKVAAATLQHDATHCNATNCHLVLEAV